MNIKTEDFIVSRETRINTDGITLDTGAYVSFHVAGYKKENEAAIIRELSSLCQRLNQIESGQGINKWILNGEAHRSGKL